MLIAIIYYIHYIARIFLCSVPSCHVTSFMTTYLHIILETDHYLFIYIYIYIYMYSINIK